MQINEVGNNTISTAPIYILSASLFKVDGTPPFSVMKSFSRTALSTMTVAELTRMFVEELIPDGVKFICGYHHSVIRYGDSVETEVVFDEEGETARKAAVHHVSLLLPLEDVRFKGAPGFLHPLDPILDYLCLAQRSGNIIPIVIFKNGLQFRKAAGRSKLQIEEVQEDEDVAECENSIGFDNYYSSRTFQFDESSIIVSHEDYDALSESSLSYDKTPSVTHKKRSLVNNKKEPKNYPLPDLQPVNPPTVLAVPGTISDHSKPDQYAISSTACRNIVQSPSQDRVKKKDRSISNLLTPSPSKRRRKIPVSYKC